MSFNGSTYRELTRWQMKFAYLPVRMCAGFTMRNVEPRLIWLEYYYELEYWDMYQLCYVAGPVPTRTTKPWRLETPALPKPNSPKSNKEKFEQAVVKQKNKKPTLKRIK